MFNIFGVRFGEPDVPEKIWGGGEDIHKFFINPHLKF